MKKILVLFAILLTLSACAKDVPSEPTEPWSFTEEIERINYDVHYRTYFSNGLIIDRWTTEGA